MKILIVTNSSLGTYKFRRELIEKLLEKHEVILSVPFGLHYEDFEKMGCRMIDTPLSRRGKNIIDEISLCKTYSKIISDEKPDVVLTFTAKPNIYVPPVCRKKGIACIVNVAGLGEPFEKIGIISRSFFRAYLSSLHKATAVFFQNADILRLFVEGGLNGDKCALLPGSGVDPDYFGFQTYPAQAEDPVFLFAGRITQDKGIDEFLYCAKKIKEKYPKTSFEIAGEIDSPEYEKIISNAQAGKTVNFRGFADDMRPVYKRAWAVVVPSYHEGLSNVCLEASSSGRAVLASDISGCRETVEDGKTGFLFEGGNKEALFNTLEKFILLPHDKKAQMGTEGRKKVEKEYDRMIVVNKYEETIIKQFT